MCAGICLELLLPAVMSVLPWVLRGHVVFVCPCLRLIVLAVMLFTVPGFRGLVVRFALVARVRLHHVVVVVVVVAVVCVRGG